MSYNHRGRVNRPNRLEVRLSAQELESLNWACAQLDRPASQLVRMAIENYVDNLGSHDSTPNGIQQEDPARDSITT